MARFDQRWWYGISALYAVGVVTASVLWPGPGAAPEFKTTAQRVQPATPPVDDAIKPGYISRTSAEGSARVFWSVPEDGQVSLTIEIPPKK
jgi:hypothetical protein